MEIDTVHSSVVHTNNVPVENQENLLENITPTCKKPSHSIKDARNEFLDALIEAELGDSVLDEDTADASKEIVVEENTELLRDLNEHTVEAINENHELNESDLSFMDTNVTNINITDDHEVEESPDLVSNNDKFVKPKNVLCHFQLGRIKRIVKADPEVSVISAESLFLISNATELFLRWLVKEVHRYTIQHKRKTIQLRDLNMAISEHTALEFLDGTLD